MSALIELHGVDKIYGAGFTPDVSILVWNKDLFRQAGLDPDKAPENWAGQVYSQKSSVF